MVHVPLGDEDRDEMDDKRAETGNCPECRTGDLVTITMTVAGRDLAFTTCHYCEAKWWKRDGEPVELGSVIDLVALKDQ